VFTIGLGQAMVPGIEHWGSAEQKAVEWSEDGKRYMAGWDLDGIKR
jgi:hypothetical protein